MKRTYQNRCFSLLLALLIGVAPLWGCVRNAEPSAAVTPPPTAIVEETALSTAEPMASPAPEATDKQSYMALVYTKEKVTFKDKANKYANFSLMREMEARTVGQRTYYFEPAISGEDRASRIQTAEELFARLGIDSELRVYFHTMLKEAYIEDGIVHVNYAGTKGAELIVALLLGVFGPFCNYGMATGFARLLLGEASEAAGELPADWAYYDLNYLCFRSAFSGEEEVELCQRLALAFVTDYVATHGEAPFLELLRKSGQPEAAEEARAALTAFYGAHGVVPELSPILYAMGGPNYDYLAKCEFSCIYLDKKWIDQGAVTEGFRSGTFLHENYGEVRDCFETLRVEMAQYQEYFGLYPYRNDLRVYFIDKKALLTGGYYDEDVHSVWMKELAVFTHEYIHSVTFAHLDHPAIAWQSEGLSTYYETRYSRYRCEAYDHFYSISLFPENEWLQLLNEDYGRPFEAEKDWMDMSSRFTFFYDAYSIGPNKTQAGYCPWGSFMEYLIRRFGEREVLAYLLDNHDLTTLTDQNIDELTADWKAENETRFAGFIKYKD